MTTATTAPTLTGDPGRTTTTRPPAGSLWPAFGTLVRRRVALSARTVREVAAPLFPAILFALVVAPALADARSGSPNGIDYMTLVAMTTLGTLIPFSCMSSGMGVIVDRLGGAQRDLITAPIPRSLIVVANLVVATLLSGLQMVVLVALAVARGAELDVRPTGVGWFMAGVVLIAVVMYGVSEVLANVIATPEEYVNTIGGVAFAPWFIAGSLFPISVLPAGLTLLAKVLPLTHALALMQYGVVDRRGAGLRDIWGMDDPAVMAAASLGVLVVCGAVATVASVGVFRRTVVS